MSIVDPQLHMIRFYKRLETVDTARIQNIGRFARMQANTEYTTYSLGMRAYYGSRSKEDQLDLANQLATISPHSPRARKIRIAAADKATPEQLCRMV